MEAVNNNVAVEFRNVSFRYNGTKEIIRNVSFQCKVGSVCALIGPSGSGKTSLLRLAARLERPSEGEVRVRAIHHHGLAKISYVSQQLDLWPNLTVLDNVTAALRYGYGKSSDAAESEVAPILVRLGLENLKVRFPSELSGGQRQRVAIARALAVLPAVLLLDEITAALDPETVADLLQMLIDLKSQGQTIVLVTHHLGFAAKFADQVFFLEDGKIIETLPGNQLLNSPRTSRLQKFVGHYQ